MDAADRMTADGPLRAVSEQENAGSKWPHLMHRALLLGSHAGQRIDARGSPSGNSTRDGGDDEQEPDDDNVGTHVERRDTEQHSFEHARAEDCAAKTNGDADERRQNTLADDEGHDAP